MTEEEAKTKWCHKTLGTHPPEGDDWDGKCLGSACMAWRTDRPKNWSVETWTPTAPGHCGLAGKA